MVAIPENVWDGLYSSAMKKSWHRPNVPIENMVESERSWCKVLKCLERCCQWSHVSSRRSFLANRLLCLHLVCLLLPLKKMYFVFHSFPGCILKWVSNSSKVLFCLESASTLPDEVLPHVWMKWWNQQFVRQQMEGGGGEEREGVKEKRMWPTVKDDRRGVELSV